jgi:hypothetical protein
MRKQSGSATGGQIPKTAGSPLPADVRAKMEPKLGADLSGVRIHTGGESAKAATGFGARAFTVGSDVHFNAGQFDPGTKEGDRLLAHELTHVVQGQQAGIQRKADDEQKGDDAGGGDLEVSQPGEPAEKEADAVADHVTDELHAEGEGNTADGKKADDKKADDQKSSDEKGRDEKRKGSDPEDAGGAKDAAANENDNGGSTKPAAKQADAAPKIQAKLDGVGRKVFLAGATGGGGAGTYVNSTNTTIGTQPAGQAGAPPQTQLSAADKQELIAAIESRDRPRCGAGCRWGRLGAAHEVKKKRNGR